MTELMRSSLLLHPRAGPARGKQQRVRHHADIAGWAEQSRLPARRRRSSRIEHLVSAKRGARRLPALPRVDIRLKWGPPRIHASGAKRLSRIVDRCLGPAFLATGDYACSSCPACVELAQALAHDTRSRAQQDIVASAATACSMHTPYV